MTQGTTGLKDALHSYMTRLGIRSDAPLAPAGALIPLSLRPGPLVRGRILLVGDAAGLVDPIIAEGITNALLSGELAARSIIAGAMNPEVVAVHYREQMERDMLRELKLSRRLAGLLYHHRQVRTLLFRAKGQRFCDTLTGIMMGTGSLTGIEERLGKLLKFRNS
jgi:flavin-dependent dehydrogenase